MSETVVKAIHLMGGYEPKETVKSIEMVDKLFDYMNVSSSSSYVCSHPVPKQQMLLCLLLLVN